MEEQFKEEMTAEEQENIVQEEFTQTENESEGGKKKKTKCMYTALNQISSYRRHSFRRIKKNG